MELGVTLAFSHRTPIDYIVGTSQRIDRAGIAAMWVPEHVVFFPDYASRYPYSDDGRVPGDPDGVLDPFIALTTVAAHTEQVRLGTGICLVPQRQPVYTAKMVADLDYLSQGRVDFGIGIGWLEEEFDALGLDFSARAARCDEYMAAMQALWTTEPASFEGETVQFKNVHFNPKPVQSPHPPIFVGGESGPALRRVARFGTGWYGYNLSVDGFTAALERLDAALADAGRARDEIAIYVAPEDGRVTPEQVAAYSEAGADQLILPLFARDLDGVDRRIEKLAASTGLL